ncbi:hypothetical protein Leryth_004912 [Lithospermum erythrorhizon]|nr:hypothetical protein Leryth_004912 [Lithospermum erythrorhizon]
MIGSCSRLVMDCSEVEARLQKFVAVKSTLGSMTEKRWWGIPWLSSGVILLVVMSRPLWTCILSELIISAGKWVAKSMESLDFPVPVAPNTITTFSFCDGSLRWNSGRSTPPSSKGVAK